MSIENTIKNMSLDERAGQLVMSSFTGRTSIPEETVELIKAGKSTKCIFTIKSRFTTIYRNRPRRWTTSTYYKGN